MEKSLKRLLAVVLSLMLMFTMGTTVFAADDVAADPTEETVVLDEEAVVDEEAAEDEAVVETTETEEAIVDEAVEEEIVKSAEIETEVGNLANIEDGTYDLDDISSSLGMFHIEKASLVVDGENSTLIIDSSNGNRFSEIYLGHYADINDENIDSIGTEGTVIDEANSIIRFEVPLKTSSLNDQMYYVLRYKAGYSDSHDHDWYRAKSGEDYYLTLGDMTKTVEIPTENITNSTGMFKAVSASIKTTFNASGTTKSLIMALSGSGYRNLFKGTFEEAVANGDNRDNWIAGYQNAAGKWEFEIPLNEGESYVPCVAISQTYLDKYDQGTNDLKRAFFPRQFEIDVDAKTLITGDYEETVTLDVVNLVSMFKPGETATVHVVGGENSTNYSTKMTLTMGSDSFTKVKTMEYSNYTGTVTEKGEVEIELDENNVFADIPVLPGRVLNLQFFSKKKQEYFDRFCTIDLMNRTVIFASSEEEAEAAVDKVAEFANATIAPIDAVTYNGEAFKPEVAVSLNGTTLVKDTDYTVKYADNTNAGTAKVTVTGAGEYVGVKSATFEIKPSTLDAVVVADILACTYTGKAQTPEVTVALGETALVLDTDYTVEYADNTNAGTAKATVKGIGNYTGEKTAEFTINPASQKLTMSTATKTVKYKKVKKKAQYTTKVAVSGAKTTVTYAKVGGSKKLKINKTTGKITVKKKTKKGTYKIKVKATAASSGNYNSATVTKTIKVKVKK